jgi:N-acetyl-anhydromuramyl-L-alanine amidase AmpD
MSKLARLMMLRPRPAMPIAKPFAFDHIRYIKAGYSLPESWGYTIRPIQAIVWHTMEGSLAGALSTFDSGVSGAHIAIARDGGIWLICPLQYVAHHAGTDGRIGSPTYGRTDYWRRVNINLYSIGIELEGYANAKLTDAQAASCLKVARYLTQQYAIPIVRSTNENRGHLAHSDISALRSDPGPFFPFQWLLASLRG